MSGFAWMVSTTVLTAGKPVTNIRPTPMSTEPVRIEFSLQNDRRLLEGARTIFAHAAKQTGLAEAVRQEFSLATLDKCREAFALAEERGRPDSAIHVLVGEFPDRVEIAIEYFGDLEPGASASKSDAKGRDGAFGMQIFDSVEGQSFDGRSRV